MKYLAGVIVAALAALWPWATAAAPAWEQWQAVPSVFDLGGPRSDGSLIVAGSAALYTLTTDGGLQPFARGPGGYREDPGSEAYLAVSPGLHVAASACDFALDDIYVLRMHTPVGVTRVDSTGEDSGSFTNVDAPGLNGIVFDTGGAFDHRLLLTGTAGTKTEVIAVDCKGATQVISRTAPRVEGGMDVAPESFGEFAGSLIAPDENTGLIWAIAPDGTAKQVVNSGMQKGSDIGVESVAFVPAGFTSRGGYVYYADRKSPTARYGGTDHVLRMSSADLVAAGVHDGDLLATTEGGASTIAVHCDTTCRVIPIVASPSAAHGEGHLVFTMNPLPSPTPTPRVTPSPTPAARGSGVNLAFLGAILAAVAGAVAAAVAASRRRR